MFSENKKNKTSNNQKDQNRIAAGTLITGEISGKGCFRIEGTLEGSLKTPGKVVISEGGAIKGTLECENADIGGSIDGKLCVKSTLSLRATAKIGGEVIAGKLTVEPGAIFNATCEMNAGVKPLKKENEKRSA